MQVYVCMVIDVSRLCVCCVLTLSVVVLGVLKLMFIGTTGGGLSYLAPSIFVLVWICWS